MSRTLKQDLIRPISKLFGPQLFVGPKSFLWLKYFLGPKILFEPTIILELAFQGPTIFLESYFFGSCQSNRDKTEPKSKKAQKSQQKKKYEIKSLFQLSHSLDPEKGKFIRPVKKMWKSFFVCLLLVPLIAKLSFKPNKPQIIKFRINDHKTLSNRPKKG